MTSRKAIIEQTKQRLQQGGAPRLEMSLIMLLTAGTGFLASFALLHLGLGSMAVRYPLAVLVAYGAFLLYLWLWLRRRRRMNDERDRQTYDAGDGSWIDLANGLSWPTGGGTSGGGGFSGQGGGFGGGGAGGSFDAPEAPRFAAGAPLPPPAPAAASSEGGGFLSNLDLDLDDDAGKALLLALVVLVILFLTAYVIYIAPALLAEVLVDGLLVSGLYRHLKHEDRRHWLATALRRTWWYFLLVALLLLIAGVLMESWYPEADSIGDVWRLLRAEG